MLSRSNCICLHVACVAPPLALSTDRRWRHPFDRMYFTDESGREKPTPEALGALHTIVMFRSTVWYMAITDM